MTPTEQILAVASAYERGSGLPETTVSWRLFNETKTLDALRRGVKSITLLRAEKALVLASRNWPEGAEWPNGVHRPSPDGAGQAGVAASDAASSALAADEVA